MEIDKKNLHHAYLLTGAQENARVGFERWLEAVGFAKENNPDLFFFESVVFGIGEARKLRVLVSRKSFGEKKMFFVAAERLTLEAQNALLKTLEEPSPGTHIFLTVREKELLIPTLRSRMQTLEVGKLLEKREENSAKFLKLSLKERLAFAKEFSDNNLSLPVFLDGLLVYLKALGHNNETLKKVLAVRCFADGTSVSARLILEHLGLVLQ